MCIRDRPKCKYTEITELISRETPLLVQYASSPFVYCASSRYPTRSLPSQPKFGNTVSKTQATTALYDNNHSFYSVQMCV